MIQKCCIARPDPIPLYYFGASIIAIIAAPFTAAEKTLMIINRQTVPSEGANSNSYLQYVLMVCALITTSLIVSSPAKAGWVVPGTGGKCVGFGCPGSPVVGSDWLKDRWEEIGEGPASATRLCKKVGYDTCSNPDFIFAYQALRAGQWNRNYYDATSCAAAGYTINDYGHTGGQLLAAAYGIAIPSDLMQLSKGMKVSHINKACNALFPNRQVDTRDIVRVKSPSGKPMYSAERDARKAKDGIRDY